jgi:hypothetical protein
MFAADSELQIVRSGNVQWNSVTPLEGVNQWLRSAQRRLTALTRLRADWDGYGSPPVQAGVIARAADLLVVLAKLDLPNPELFPVPGGGLQLEFRQDNRELEIEILPDSSIEYLLVENGTDMREGAVRSEPDYFSGVIGEIPLLAFWLQGKNVTAYQFELE